MHRSIQKLLEHGCDVLDDDMDGDGILNDEETNTGDSVNDLDAVTDAANPDSDGDGVCDEEDPGESCLDV